MVRRAAPAPTADLDGRPARRRLAGCPARCRRERAALRRPRRPGHPPASGGPRLRLHRGRRPADPVGTGARAHPRDRDPAGVDGRLDLSARGRAHPGDRARRARSAAVPLPRRLPRPPRPWQVRPTRRVRRAAPEDPPPRPRGSPPTRTAARKGARGRGVPARGDAAAGRQPAVRAPQSLVRLVDAPRPARPRDGHDHPLQIPGQGRPDRGAGAGRPAPRGARFVVVRTCPARTCSSTSTPRE